MGNKHDQRWSVSASRALSALHVHIICAALEGRD